MSPRPTKSTEYIRHTFTSDERLKMGDELAQAHNRMAEIEDEEQVIKSQIKERKAQVEQTVSKLSRELANGFTMQNVECRLDWDSPNPNEVSYVRTDTGEVVKTRPFTEAERQQDLPLDDKGTIAIEAIAPDKSAENVATFFGTEDEESDEEDSEDDEETDEEEAEAEPAEPTHVQVGRATRNLRKM